MSVFDSAGKPLRAVDLALRVIDGNRPLSDPLGGRATLEDIHVVVAEAMCIANESGLLKASELLFEEALIISEGVVHPCMAKQV